MLENREDTIFNLGMYDPCILFILYPNGWIACDLEGYIIINGEKWEQKRRNIGIHSQLEVFWRLYNKQDHPDKYFLNGRMWLSKKYPIISCWNDKWEWKKSFKDFCSYFNLSLNDYVYWDNTRYNYSVDLDTPDPKELLTTIDQIISPNTKKSMSDDYYEKLGIFESLILYDMLFESIDMENVPFPTKADIIKSFMSGYHNSINERLGDVTGFLEDFYKDYGLRFSVWFDELAKRVNGVFYKERKFIIINVPPFDNPEKIYDLVDEFMETLHHEIVHYKQFKSSNNFDSNYKDHSRQHKQLISYVLQQVERGAYSYQLARKYINWYKVPKFEDVLHKDFSLFSDALNQSWSSFNKNEKIWIKKQLSKFRKQFYEQLSKLM